MGLQDSNERLQKCLGRRPHGVTGIIPEAVTSELNLKGRVGESEARCKSWSRISFSSLAFWTG